MTADEAYRHCRAVVLERAGNFRYAFYVLSGERRRGMDALYTYMRAIDDLADDQTRPVAERRGELDRLKRLVLSKGLNGPGPAEDAEPDRSSTGFAPIAAPEWWPALVDTVRRFDVNPRHLADVIDGVGTDLEPVAIATFDDLYRYCYLVASVVGLACTRIWGATDPAHELPAERNGVAFQVTNILRDLVEDHRLGRRYLPAEDLARFGIAASDFPLDSAGQPPRGFDELMRFEIERARGYFEEGAATRAFLPREGRAVFDVMTRTYRELLETIARDPRAVLVRRVRVSRFRKLSLVLAGLAGRWIGN